MPLVFDCYGGSFELEFDLNGKYDDLPAVAISHAGDNWGALHGSAQTGMLASTFDVNNSECDGIVMP